MRSMAEKNGFRIGIGQIHAVANDVAGNLERIEEMIDRADDEGIDHVVFPELALTGYIVDERFAEAAVKLESRTVDQLRRLSHRVGLSVGLIEETRDSLFYNSVAFFEEGAIRHVHRKVYLPTYGPFDERRYYAAGWDVSAFATSLGRVGMLICGDAWHLPLAYLAAHDGANVLLIAAASSRDGLAQTTPCEQAWRWMCQSYGLTLSCFVVFANLAGEDDGHDFWGGSFIAGPDGNLLAQSQTNQSDLVVADLDLAELREQRIRLPFRRDDSIAHTIQLARRVMSRKMERDRFFEHRDGVDLPAAPKPR